MNNKLTDAEIAQLEAKEKAFFEKYPDCPKSENIKVLNLVMKREFAEAILHGEKPVEFRGYTQHYCDRLYDKKVYDYGEKIADEDLDDYNMFATPLRVVETIHFHPYNNSWWLDVECIENGMVCPETDNVEYLEENYGDKELRALMEDCEAKRMTKRPLMFYFAVGKVLDTNLK